jgi:hypothetical protein
MAAVYCLDRTYATKELRVHTRGGWLEYNWASIAFLSPAAIPAYQPSPKHIHWEGALSSIDSDSHLIERALLELIEALDRRVPRVERMGEAGIARDAEALREKARKRLTELQDAR